MVLRITFPPQDEEDPLTSNTSKDLHLDATKGDEDNLHLKSAWYYPDITRIGAERLLIDRQTGDGSYLVRPSEYTPVCILWCFY